MDDQDELRRAKRQALILVLVFAAASAIGGVAGMALVIALLPFEGVLVVAALIFATCVAVSILAIRRAQAFKRRHSN
jgi:hypothetical protein